MSETTCQVFYPEVGDMVNLAEYIGSLEKVYPNIGVCKLVPPLGWYTRSYDLTNIDLPKIPAIKQLVDGRGGSYHVTSLEVKTKTLPEFHTHALKFPAELTPINDRVRHFWRSLNKGDAPLYGADIEGSLFEPSTATSDFGLQNWNLNNGLSDILRLLPYQIPGVNTTMIYVGMWRAMFAFHVEDLDLYSINYLHMGAAKSWYSISPANRQRFEAISDSHYAGELRECKEYMRHKTKLFSPTLLKDCGMEYNTAVQQPGEFVVTFPGSYHAGFNHGFNIAEATNFATPRWLTDLARKAKRCVCRPHSVYINIDELETIYRRKLVAETSSAAAAAAASSSSAHKKNLESAAGCYDNSGTSSGSVGASNIRDMRFSSHSDAGHGYGVMTADGVVDLTQEDDESDSGALETGEAEGADDTSTIGGSTEKFPEDLPRMRCECGCLGLVSQQSLADLYLRNLAASARRRASARTSGGSSISSCNNKNNRSAAAVQHEAAGQVRGTGSSFGDGGDGEGEGEGDGGGDVEPYMEYATDRNWSEDHSRSRWGEITSPTSPDLPVARCVKCHFYVHLACVAKYPEAHTVCHLCRRIDKYAIPPQGECSSSGVAGSGFGFSSGFGSACARGNLLGKRKVQPMQARSPEEEGEEEDEEVEKCSQLTISFKKRKPRRNLSTAVGVGTEAGTGKGRHLTAVKRELDSDTQNPHSHHHKHHKHKHSHRDPSDTVGSTSTSSFTSAWKGTGEEGKMIMSADSCWAAPVRSRPAAGNKVGCASTCLEFQATFTKAL